MDWLQLIGAYGFPIVACCFMGWYLKYITDRHREETRELNRQHAEEMEQLKDALNNNTIVLTRICTILDGGVNDEHLG